MQHLLDVQALFLLKIPMTHVNIRKTTAVRDWTCTAADDCRPSTNTNITKHAHWCVSQVQAVAVAEAERRGNAVSQQAAPGTPQHRVGCALEPPQQCATPQLMADAAATAASCTSLVLGAPQQWPLPPPPPQCPGGTLPPSSRETPRAARIAALAKLRARASGRTGGTSIAASMVPLHLEAPPAIARLGPTPQPAPLALLPPQLPACQASPVAAEHTAPEAADETPIAAAPGAGAVPLQPRLTVHPHAAAEQQTAAAAEAAPGSDPASVNKDASRKAAGASQPIRAVAEAARQEAKPADESLKERRQGRRWSILPRLRMTHEEDSDPSSEAPPSQRAAAAQEADATHITYGGRSEGGNVCPSAAEVHVADRVCWLCPVTEITRLFRPICVSACGHDMRGEADDLTV